MLISFLALTSVNLCRIDLYLVMPFLEEGKFEKLADLRLENNFDGGEMFQMVEAAAICVCHSARRRPGMGQVGNYFVSSNFNHYIFIMPCDNVGVTLFVFL